jgi:hypothetical protein
MEQFKQDWAREVETERALLVGRDSFFGRRVAYLANWREAGFRQPVYIERLDEMPERSRYRCAEFAVGGMNNYSKSINTLKKRISSEGFRTYGLRAIWLSIISDEN